LAGHGADVAPAKAALRRQIRQRLKALLPGEREQASASACERLVQQEVWAKARSVLCYAAMAEELDIGALIDHGLAAAKVVALPQFDPAAGIYRACQITTPLSALAVGHFGIVEPGAHCASFALKQLDLILVPGLAFDLSGHRLGRGRGYYDRLLADTPAIKCGVAFDEQVQSQIPVETHDVLLDCILTPTRWLDFRPR
jgi:5-formyltetrahydrofolate cyclo-ligase